MTPNCASTILKKDKSYEEILRKGKAHQSSGNLRKVVAMEKANNLVLSKKYKKKPRKKYLPKKVAVPDLLFVAKSFNTLFC